MYNGRISIIILHASKLPEKNGMQQAYVQVKVDNQEVLKTKTATDPFCPVWDENIDFYKENANMLRFVGVSVRALCS